MSEYFDVLNSRGEYTGEVESRENCHKNGLWHKAVVIFVVSTDNKRILLQQRSANKRLWPNLWDMTAGGHVDAGELGYQAVIREAKEETGLTLNSFIYRGEILFINNIFKEVMYLYTSSDYSGEIIECDEGELKWISFKDIPSLNLWEGDRIFLPKLINSESIINLELYYENDKLVKVVDKEGQL